MYFEAMCIFRFTESTSCKIIFEFAAIFIVRSVRKRKVCIPNEECRKFPIFVGKYRGTRYTRCEKNFWTVIPLKNQLTLFLDRVNLSS